MQNLCELLYRFEHLFQNRPVDVLIETDIFMWTFIQSRFKTTEKEHRRASRGKVLL